MSKRTSQRRRVLRIHDHRTLVRRSSSFQTLYRHFYRSVNDPYHSSSLFEAHVAPTLAATLALALCELSTLQYLPFSLHSNSFPSAIMLTLHFVNPSHSCIRVQYTLTLHQPIHSTNPQTTAIQAKLRTHQPNRRHLSTPF